MDLNVLKNEEKLMNMIMILFNLCILIVALAYVLLFNGGCWIDAVVLLMPLLNILVKILEKPLGKYAKYLYISIIPVIGAITIVVPDDGVFGAMTNAYFLVTVLAVLYYNLNVIKVNAIATIVPNAILMIFFTDAFTKMPTFSIWIFILMVYALLLITCAFITIRAEDLFQKVEVKEKEVEQLLDTVRTTFDSLQESTGNIFKAISGVEELSQEIVGSTEEIAASADIQIEEINGSVQIFNELNDGIYHSQSSVNETVENMNQLKEKNDEGKTSIGVLAKMFDKNISATQEAADEINNLSGESTRATQKIDEILKDITETIKHTSEIMEDNHTIVKESHVQLNNTVDVFENILQSSEAVIHVTDGLKDSLANIFAIKDKLKVSMDKVETMSKQEAGSTAEISSSTVEQVAGVEEILKSIQSVRKGMEDLAAILNKG